MYSTISYSVPDQVCVIGHHTVPYEHILNYEALEFIKALHQQFDAARQRLLQLRLDRQKEMNAGKLPSFLPHTAETRNSEWTIAPIPEELQDRRVEITGPVDRKMIINALNSGAKVFMADFEDSNSPTWSNTIEGQINLFDAVRKTIAYEHPRNGKTYELKDETAILFVRPRGWHLSEKHILVDDVPVSASLVDFGLFFFHNAKELMRNGSAPYFYLPKLENHLEAHLWNEVFRFAQTYLEIPNGTIKATVLIETLTAAFELDEILYELKDHSAGLNCGRWDYIFSYIKKLQAHDILLPDRSQVGMTTAFMRAYSQRVIQVCHRRGAHAMGGMAAQIPVKNDEEANKVAMEKVQKDKLREVVDGHDGTWVAHPALIAPVLEIFNEHMPQPNQIDKKLDDVVISEADLLEEAVGSITEAGVRMNINVGILYIESWLQGVGAAALYHLMEDAATAEISRTQLWQWLRAEVELDNGLPFTEAVYDKLKAEELLKIQAYIGEDRYQNGRFEEAIHLFDRLVKSEQLTEFLTLDAYALID